MSKSLSSKDILGSLYVSGTISSGTTTGSSPLSILSTTLVSNLNADMLDGYHASSFLQLTSLSAVGPILYNNNTGVFSLGTIDGGTP